MENVTEYQALQLLQKANSNLEEIQHQIIQLQKLRSNQLSRTQVKITIGPITIHATKHNGDQGYDREAKKHSQLMLTGAAKLLHVAKIECEADIRKYKQIINS